MNRSVDLKLAELNARDLCRVHGVPFFSTKDLPLGGTRTFAGQSMGPTNFDFDSIITQFSMNHDGLKFE